jgi:hypothetical protein
VVGKLEKREELHVATCCDVLGAAGDEQVSMSIAFGDSLARDRTDALRVCAAM